MREIGRAIARLHQAAREFGFPAPDNEFRADYRYDHTLAASHLDWIAEHRATIGAEHAHLLYLAVDWLIKGLNRIGETPDTYGFIHADLHLGNFLMHEGQIAVIDFDQSGRGHYGYELAVLMVNLLDEPEAFSIRWEHLKRGYQLEAKLPFAHDDELNLFVVAVDLAFLDWVYNSPNPLVREEQMRRMPAKYESIRRCCI